MPERAAVDELLANIAAQSQLTFRRETRTMSAWVLGDGVAGAASQPAP